MIFLLDIVLAFNVWLAHRIFKNLVSPPMLMGIGMLAASLMATSYYDEWNMGKMLPESVFILGGGTLFFTICCSICMTFFKVKGFNELSSYKTTPYIDRKTIKIFFIISIIIGATGILLKLFYLRNVFGSLGLQELILAKRLDEWNGINDFVLPSYVRQLGSYTTIVSYFTLWVSSLFVTNKNLNKKLQLKWLLVAHLSIIFIDGMLSGSKAPILNMVLFFGIFFVYNYYSNNGSYKISKNFFIRISLIVILLAISFRSLSLLIGRAVEDVKNIDLLAEYCGAEIKNFDIFMHQSHTVKGKRWGENTFYGFYKDIDPNFYKANGEFQLVGNYSLGNVYTQFRPFYEDFGMIGVFVMCAFMALLSMFLYSKASNSLVSPLWPNVFLFIYTSVAMSIFMAFFSSKFTEIVCRLGWIRTTIYLAVLTWFIKRFIFKNKISSHG